MNATPNNNALKYKTVIGRERALLDALSQALQKVVGGPPPSKKTMAELHRHNSWQMWPTQQGNAFDVQIVGPDGKPTGHIARVTIELDRWEVRERQHAKVPHGYCAVCGHYGEDCTGETA